MKLECWTGKITQHLPHAPLQCHVKKKSPNNTILKAAGIPACTLTKSKDVCAVQRADSGIKYATKISVKET